MADLAGYMANFTTFMAGLGLEVMSLLGMVYFATGKNRVASTHSPNEYLAVTSKLDSLT